MLPTEVTMERIPCECGSFEEKPILIGEDWINHLPGEFQIVRCQACGLMRTNPRPSQDTIKFYYPDNYAPYLTTQVRQTNKSKKVKKGLKKWLSNHFNANSKTIIPDIAPGNLLEIGCGSGDFLMTMQRQGWKVNGLEPSETAADSAKQQGLNVACGILETAEIPAGHYDMIVAWMVIEHLHYPMAGLAKLQQALKPGGVLVISVPDLGGLDFRLFKQHYYSLHLPNHLFHYTQPTLKQLISKAGFSQTQFFWHRNPNNLLASLTRIFAIRQQPRLESFMQKVLDRKRLKLFSKILGWLLAVTKQSGRMTVWAYK
ncbi:MAG: class I SAM-dependent methyltransferase [Methylovulum sp.]|nr:class I SAM-dependent methyltransferase [Methylovulum sp.]